MLKVKTLKKSVSAVTMFATVIALSGVSMLAPLTASADIVDGALISSNATNSDGTPTYESLDTYIVKIVGEKKYKRLVLNPEVFNSYGHLDWNDIQEVDQSVVDEYETSSLVRVDGDDRVWALTPDDDSGAKSWIELTAEQFVDEAGADSDSIYTINDVDAGNYSTLGAITTVAELEDFFDNGTLPEEVTGEGDLNVALSSSTPESTNIPTSNSAEFTAVKLSAGSEDVSINSITVTASGFGTATNLDDVSLYIDGSKVGTSKDINSEKVATFNFSTPIEISANGSKTLTIRATAAAAGTYVLGIEEADDIITAGGSVEGSFPVEGNGMSADSYVSAGTVTLGSVDNSSTTNSFGEDDVLLAAFDLTANNEGAIIDSLRMKNGGTNNENIISNVRLLINGDEIAEGEYDSSTGYVTFAIDGDYKIDKSDTASVEVYGDLGVSNASDTVKLYIKNKDDFAFIGEDYGFGVQLTSATFALLDAYTEGITVTLTTGDITINFDKAATPTQDVKADTDNVVLATFEITSNGEDATVNSISDTGAADFEIQGTGLTTGEIENVEMRDVDSGAIYDITATFDTDHWELAMSDEFSLAQGVTKTFEIRADLDATIDNADTLKVVLGKAAISITGDESDATITDITPASLVSAISTVDVASLTWTTTSLNAKTVVPSTSDVVIYRATVKAGDVDDVKLSTVTLTTNGAGVVDDFTDNNISEINLYLDGVLIKNVSNAIQEAVGGTPGYVTFNSLITSGDANVIPAGESVTLEAKANFASTLTHTANFSLEIDSATTSIISRSVSDNNVIVESVANVGTGSRIIGAAAKGTLKVELLTSDTDADQNAYVLAGASTPADEYMGEIKFTTANEDIRLTELRLENGGTATSSDIEEVQLVDEDGTVVLSELPASDGDVVFTGLDLVLPADEATSYFIAIVAKGMNVDGDPTSTATHGATAVYNINATAGVVAEGVDSGESITLVVDPDAGAVATGQWSAASITSKTDIISGAVLNTVTSDMSDGTLVGGTNKVVGQYTFVFENGSNRTAANEELKAIMDKLVITVSKSSAVALTNVKANIEGTSTKVAADTETTLTAGTTSGTATWNALTLQGLADGGQVDGAITIVITADVVTTAADSEYVQTSIADLDGTADFNFIGNGLAAGTAFTDMYLPVTEVTGATLSE